MNLVRSAILLGSLLALTIPLTLVSLRESHAAATWVDVYAPFSGYWDRFGFSPPATHPAATWPDGVTADWATDFYKEPSTTGKWYRSSSSGSFVTTTVNQALNACNASSWTWAGLKYRFVVANDSGTLGWFADVHVDPNGYFLGVGAGLTNGMLIGYTKRWGYSSGCYEVSSDSGVHWHIEAYNYSMYSCYAPNATGASLAAGSGMLGAVGANATGPRQSCW